MPTDVGSTEPVARTGPVLFAFDGSELAGLAIEEAARLLGPGRAALVACVWQPADVGFVLSATSDIDADQATEVAKAAAETAERGAALAKAAGFRPESLAFEASPTWQGIVDIARSRRASLIVVGSHRRAGLVGHFHGNFAAALIARSTSSVLVVNERT